MADLVEKFGDRLYQELFFKGINGAQPGTQIFPPKSSTTDDDLQMHLDAGEIEDGLKTINLLPDPQATAEPIKQFIEKNTVDTPIASGKIKANVPEEDAEATCKELWYRLAAQATQVLS